MDTYRIRLETASDIADFVERLKASGANAMLTDGNGHKIPTTSMLFVAAATVEWGPYLTLISDKPLTTILKDKWVAE